MNLTDEQFDRLVLAITKISHGHDQPHGIESLVMALTGDGISGRESLPRQVYHGLDAVANAIHELAEAYHERTRKLG